MVSGRIEAVNRVIRIVLVFLTPISLYIAVYPGLVLGLLGSEYLDASFPLSILLLNSVPVMIVSGLNSYIYSSRDYRGVLYLGLSQSIPRIILYLVLVPMYSSLGAALSYTIGSYIGLTYAILISRINEYKLDLVLYLKIVLIASSIALLYLLKIPWYTGLPLLFLVYTAYFKTGLIDEKDLLEIINALLFWRR